MGEVALVGKVSAVMPAQRFDDPFADRQRSQRMTETRVFGARKRQVREPKLSQTSKPLHRFGGKQRHLGIIEFNEIVDRIEYALDVVMGSV